MAVPASSSDSSTSFTPDVKCSMSDSTVSKPSVVYCCSTCGVMSRASACSTATRSSQYFGGMDTSCMSTPSTSPPRSRGPSCWQATCSHAPGTHPRSSTLPPAARQQGADRELQHSPA
eukprot:GHRQ01035248.1.p1 GENE.GHRQ01035248.1~~GHRQ01035248.1.p1  ORF type:complete len:118 (-),score=15.90 GHRQ01035248.1:74-427(-)